MRIHLWERALSPHLGNVLTGLAKLGHKVSYVVQSETYAHRTAEGWVRPAFPGVQIVMPKDPSAIRAIVEASDPDDIHICVGLRGNAYIADVVASLRAEKRRFLVFMETIDERGRLSFLKRFIYRAVFWRHRALIEGVLATGAATPAWVAARGVSRCRIFDFAYFLSPNASQQIPERQGTAFRLLFVGNLIERKRVHLILEALADLPAHTELDVVGDGELREALEAQARGLAPGRVTFHGARPMPEIEGFMAAADCLVLPSAHDGWGAVVSEAMITGTPVVCSDRCGASVAVRASGLGQVFLAHQHGACAKALADQVQLGPPSPKQRAALAEWAHCLTEMAGAAYLEKIVAHLRQGGPRPAAPWDAK